jgi:uncharacterized membrane protein
MLERIGTLVRRRRETDRRMSYGWMIIPILPLAAAVAIASSFVGILVSTLPKISNISQTTAQSTLTPVVGGLVALYGSAILIYFGVLFLGAVSFYYMIDRRNRHFSRQQLLFSTLHQYLAFKAPQSGNVMQVGYLAEDSSNEERSRSAGLWALLFMFVTPVTGLILSYCLTQDLRKHDELQSKFQAALPQSLTEAGYEQPNFAPYKPRGGDPVLFIILSAITGGLFWVYWYYTLLRDYNGHFADQAIRGSALEPLVSASGRETLWNMWGSSPKRRQVLSQLRKGTNNVNGLAGYDC